MQGLYLPDVRAGIDFIDRVGERWIVTAGRETIETVLLVSCASDPSFSDEIAPKTRLVLESPDGLEILPLHPFPHAPGGEPEEGSDFHGYRILGRAEVTDPLQRKGLIDLVAIGIDESDGTVAACFNPRHGLRVFESATAMSSSTS